MRRMLRGGPLLVLALVLSCGFLTTSIKDIRDDPRKYAGKTVTVSGEVKSVTNLLVVKYFTLDDSTGEMSVITERPLPKSGTRVRVTGTVHEAFALGDRSALVIEERGGEAK